MVKEIENQEQESESEPESESEGEEEKLSTEPSKNAIYNSEALLEKIEDIAWPKKIDWIHKLTIDHQQAEKVDVDDDLARELAFYTQALDSTRVAFSKIQKIGVPFLRPPDYYAEMVKSDSHMLKIKDKLLYEKKMIEEMEERRKMRENKKISKQVQHEKLREREKSKKDEIESVKKWRKQREREGYVKGEKGNDEVFGFEKGDDVFDKVRKKRPGVAPFDRSGGKNKGKGSNKGRDRRDSKFGFGGRKALKKQNTAETTNDFRGFRKGGDTGGNNKKRKRVMWCCESMRDETPGSTGPSHCLSQGSIIADFVIPSQKVSIVNANLTRFELVGSSVTSLSYNLTFSMSIHNSVWYNKADYHEMEVDCYYNTEQFDALKLGNFRLKQRRTRILNFSRSGNSTINLGSSGVDAFRRSNETGNFNLEIWLKGVRIYQTEEGDHHEHLSYQCKMNLQLITSQNNSTQANFQPVKCR